MEKFFSGMLKNDTKAKRALAFYGFPEFNPVDNAG
jgi:hypothetical protein